MILYGYKAIGINLPGQLLLNLRDCFPYYADGTYGMANVQSNGTRRLQRLQTGDTM